MKHYQWRSRTPPPPNDATLAQRRFDAGCQRANPDDLGMRRNVGQCRRLVVEISVGHARGLRAGVTSNSVAANGATTHAAAAWAPARDCIEAYAARGGRVAKAVIIAEISGRMKKASLSG